MSRFYLTTAIDYVNSRPHLGTAYEKICADVIARYKRLCGIETRFVMGNDEHSQNVYRSAIEQGLHPIAYCDRMEQEFTTTWRGLDISFDDFIRTTEPRHAAGVTALIRRVYVAGDIAEGTYQGWYCLGCEAFKQEKDFIDGKCALHPATAPQWINEKNYFFRLSKYRQPLLDHFGAHSEFLLPDIRRNEILRLIEGGLEEISISRAGQAWGIPLPFDASGVVYVWFDALVNYLSAVGLGGDEEMLERWWPADLHVIGKDITRFHAVIWPAMLMSAKLPLPRQVFAHGFMTFNGRRMSKSLGTIVDPVEAARRHGVDPLRLYVVKEIAFGGDGDFSWERYDERYNVDLANNLGNLVSRVSAMVHRYRGGQLRPAAETTVGLADVAGETCRAYRDAMDRYAIHEGAAAAYRLIDAANVHITETTPWTLAKDPAGGERLTQVLFDAVEAIRLAAVLLAPIMPASSIEILRRVGVSGRALNLDRDGLWRGEGERVVLQEAALWPRIDSGPQAAVDVRTVQKKEPAVVKEQSIQPDAASAAAVGPPAPEATASVAIDEFMKIDLRAARVLAAERVPKSKKLLKLLVDVGTEQRTIVAGIAETYEPEAMVGRTVVVVFNLRPAKLMGVESNGMVLAAATEGGKQALLGFDQPPPPGSRVR